MRLAVRVLYGVVLPLATCTTGLAQTPSVLLSEGVVAYNELEFEVASILLVRALHSEADPKLSADERDRAMMYLGAANLFRGQRDSSTASFERLILANPRYRADELIFPPRVTRVFDGVRQIIKVTAVNVPREGTLLAGTDQLTIRVFASSAHPITALIADERGRPLRMLYTGRIEDSLRVSWDGLDAAGAPPAAGRYRLDVVSRTAQDAVLRTQRVPLVITRHQVDPLPIPLPPEPVYRTEKAGTIAGLKFLVPGVVIGAAVMLPAAVGDTEGSTARYLLGGAFSVGGIVGFFSERGRTRRVEDTAAADSVRADWRQRVAAIRRENLRRGASVGLEIRAGAPRRIEGTR